MTFHDIGLYIYTTPYRRNDRLPSAELRLRSTTVPLTDNSRQKANQGNLKSKKKPNGTVYTCNSFQRLRFQ
jgi:hypothetical protein